MGMLQNSPISIAPLLLKNLLTSIFISVDNSLVKVSENYRLLQLIRYLLISCFIFFLRFLPSLFVSSSACNSCRDDCRNGYGGSYSKQRENDTYALAFQSNTGCSGSGSGSSSSSSEVYDCGVVRALSQLLSIVNDIPVSSRKYEIVRSLADNIIEDNNREGTEVLLEVNRVVLSAAFTRTLAQLEAAVLEKGRGIDGGDETGLRGVGPMEYKRLSRFLKAVCDVGGWRRRVNGGRQVKRSAEKLAAELLWLAEKMSGCDCGDEAVCRWAAAGKLGWQALTAEPRVQGWLVKVSAFLFKQGKGMGEDEMEEMKKEQQKQAKLKMMLSWLPLLCRANNGTDIPTLSNGERIELQKILEEMIEKMEKKEEQEQVLSLWLHHYTHCSSTDWPNLFASYTRWCNASRKQLLLQ